MGYITLNFHYLQIQPLLPLLLTSITCKFNPFTAKINYLQIQRPVKNLALKLPIETLPYAKIWLRETLAYNYSPILKTVFVIFLADMPQQTSS